MKRIDYLFAALLLTLTSICTIGFNTACAQELSSAGFSSTEVGEDNIPVQVTGVLTILYVDDFTQKKEKLIYNLRDNKTGKTYNLRFAKPAPEYLRTGKTVTVRGTARGNTIYPAQDEAGNESIKEVKTPLLMGASPLVSGEQKTIVLLINFLDTPLACTADAVQDLMFTDTADLSVDDLYQETSFGNIWFSGDVVGPYTINYRSTDACQPGPWATAAEAQAQAAGVNLTAYKRKVYVLPNQNTCGWAGLGSVGGNPSTAWIVRCSMEDVYAHELGHNLGMHHSSTPSNEYGDTSDIMGYGGLGLRQINGPHKEQMGWLAQARIVNVTAGGLYEVAPLEMDAALATAPQALKIAKPDTGEYYYLTYRMPIGFDANLAYNYLRRLTVHRYRGDGSATRTYLLQTLDDGGAFLDSVNGITVTQFSHTDDYVTVQVDFSSAPPSCSPAAPVMNISPASQSTGPGTTVRYTVTLTNADNMGCAASTFSLSRVVPSGWTGTVSPAAITLLPGATGQATLSVTSASGAADGSYAVRVEAADSTTPVHTASVNANYEVLAQCRPAVPTVAIFPPSQSAYAGTAVTYTITLRNNDTVQCGNTTFSLGRVVPSGWTGTVSPATLTFLPGTTGQATLSVTSATGDAAGSYGVWVDVSDNRDPLHSTSVSASYLVQAECIPAPPAVAISPESQSARAGTMLDYAVSLTNNDANCPLSVFTLDRIVPQGWTGTISPATMELLPGETGAATLSVTSPAGAVDGSYALEATVSDDAEPAHSSSGQADYVVTVDQADIQPPTAPAGLKAMVRLMKQQINLSWIAASDNVMVAGYRLWRDGSLIADTASTIFVDRDVMRGSTYTYQVVAYDAAGNISAPSNSVTVSYTASKGGKGRK